MYDNSGHTPKLLDSRSPDYDLGPAVHPALRAYLKVQHQTVKVACRPGVTWARLDCFFGYAHPSQTFTGSRILAGEKKGTPTYLDESVTSHVQLSMGTV